jgi:hypothetical protein
MNKLTVAGIIVTVFLLLGPYFGIRIFGDPVSRFLQSDSDLNLNSETAEDYSQNPQDYINPGPGHFNPEQDDLMEPVPAEELLIE